MSTKAKGSRGERELIKMFWAEGWAGLRAAGSGSTSFPSPDILVGNKVRILAIEAKVTKENKKYFPKDEIRQLLNFSSYFGAESWLAIKFLSLPWMFFSPEDLIDTGASFAAYATEIEMKGVSFNDLIQKN